MASYQTPEQLKLNARVKDNAFAPAERLFYLFPKLDGGEVSFQEIQFPDQSTNRAKYCGTPEWLYLTLYPKYLSYGIASFETSAIPFELTSSTTKLKYYFFAEHDPLDDNYSHTEVRCKNKDGIRIPFEEKKRIHKSVKMAYRMEIGQASAVLRAPESFEASWLAAVPFVVQAIEGEGAVAQSENSVDDANGEKNPK